MAFEQLSSNDRVRLNDFMDSGLKILQEVEDLKEGLKDTTKALAEEFDIKPGILTQALNRARKSNLDEARDTLDLVESILQATGRA